MTDKVTAGRDALGRFAPTFAALNDDVLFGQIWSREEAFCSGRPQAWAAFRTAKEIYTD